MITIVDYGMGNLHSVQKAVERVGYTARVTRKPKDITQATGLILPGVGAFRDCMRLLSEYGLLAPLREYLASGRPFLGICLGLQVLFEGSDEAPGTPGLGVFRGYVRRFAAGLKVPHMGWNSLKILQPAPILEGIPEGAYVYFVHSYYVDPEDLGIVAATADYGGDFATMIRRGNIFATQFHPEKSQALGLKILANFGRLVEGEGGKCSSSQP